MKRILFVLASALLAFFVSSPAAHAVTDFDNAPSGAHYAKGSGEPVCTISGVTVTCTGTTIGGVGNTNAVAELTVTTTTTGYCRNPGSKSKVVDPFTETDTNTTVSEPLRPDRNGQLRVPSQSGTGTSSQEFQDSFECPNENWEPVVTSTAISYRYTLTFAGFTDPAIVVTGP